MRSLTTPGPAKEAQNASLMAKLQFSRSVLLLSVGRICFSNQASIASHSMVGEFSHRRRSSGDALFPEGKWAAFEKGLWSQLRECGEFKAVLDTKVQLFASGCNLTSVV